MLNEHAKSLGYLGLLPFIAIPFYIIWGNISYFEGISFYTQYSAIILSFLGGILWYDGILNKKPKRQIYFAMLPSLVGWFSLILMPPLVTLCVLSIAFILVIAYEFKALVMDPWYRSLRIRLTAITLVGHGMMIWLVLKSA
ncbi:DUF3429 domain-containing protein [Aliiglaciecola sp.]|nr:DUF3429 domain-containing protein [Aliiglaciecola sp.]